MTDDQEPGHYIEVNGHKIFGYSRYVDFYRTIIQNAEDDQIFVELGSFLGQSTAAMAFFIEESKKEISFYAIDIFEISEFSDEPHSKVIENHGGNFFEAFIDNLEKARIKDYVLPLKGKSLDMVNKFNDRSISYIMIDASHKYEDVVDDIKAWFPKMKMGGIISGDDYDWPDVSRAARDTLGNVRVTDKSTWVIRKVGETLEEHKAITAK
ncbi:MAG: class I SAM-dependent methyltransferase [Proteobacteria bacterium]|nr:class I SAM-dependent methyltransferase [Pseudomonadota bacterium]